MHLSSVYHERVKWVMIYHTSFDSEEVEMMTGDIFFDTEKDAWDWFHGSRRIHHYIQPEAVKVRLGSLTLSRQE